MVPRNGDLVSLVYETVEAPDLWEDVVASIAGEMGAQKGAMFGTNLRGAGGFATSGYCPEQVSLYAQHYYSTDLWAAAAMSGKAKEGTPYFSADLVPDAELVRSEFYVDYLARFSDHHGCGINFRSDDGVMTVLNFVRDYARGEFEGQDAELLGLIAPHIHRGLHLRAMFERADSTSSRLRAALDAITCPLFIVNDRCRVLEMNEAADRLLQASPGVVLHQNTLGFRHASADARLRALVSSSLTASADCSASPGGAFKLPETDGPQFNVVVSPLRTVLQPGALPKSYVLVMLPLCYETIALPQVRARLADIYSLTPAEARLLEAVAQGCELEEISKRLNLSINTVRSYLKSLHTKMDCTSRAQLVSSALRESAWWIR